jgi:hypothetical protein
MGGCLLHVSMGLLHVAAAQCGGLDTALLNFTGHEVDAVLGYNNKISLVILTSNTKDFLDAARELLSALYEHLLIRIRILSKKSTALVRINIVVKEDGLILKNCQLRGL